MLQLSIAAEVDTEPVSECAIRVLYRVERNFTTHFYEGVSTYSRACLSPIGHPGQHPGNPARMHPARPQRACILLAYQCLRPRLARIVSPIASSMCTSGSYLGCTLPAIRHCIRACLPACLACSWPHLFALPDAALPAFKPRHNPSYPLSLHLMDKQVPICFAHEGSTLDSTLDSTLGSKPGS